ncbi:MAG TPA: hypothetical protein VGF94_12435 [Kofleriaceae bacterium]
MKLLRNLGIALALFIPVAALAQPEPADCCGMPCCPHCPHCPHH